MDKNVLTISKYHSKKEERTLRTIASFSDDKTTFKGVKKHTEKEIRAFQKITFI